MFQFIQDGGGPSELPYCCGVGVVSMDWTDCTEDLPKRYRLKRYNNYIYDTNYYVVDPKKIGQRLWSNNVKAINNELRKNQQFKLFVTTIIDKDKVAFKKMNTALLRNGWKKTGRTKSNHGRYFIHMYIRKYV